MIALNEIYEKSDYFKQKYKMQGYHFNFNKLIKLTEQFKSLELEINSMRANCNKMCGKIAFLRNNDDSVNKLINQINSLDNEINKKTQIHKKMLKKINAILKKLPNVALEDNLTDIVSVQNKKTNIKDFEGLLKQITNQENKKDKSYFKTNSNVVFKSENLPVINKFENNYTIFYNENNENIFDILKYLDNNSSTKTILSIKNLKKVSQKSCVYSISNAIIYVDFIGEYLAREYNIKYTNDDISKFVKQINIKIKN